MSIFNFREDFRLVCCPQSMFRASKAILTKVERADMPFSSETMASVILRGKFQMTVRYSGKRTGAFRKVLTISRPIWY